MATLKKYFFKRNIKKLQDQSKDLEIQIIDILYEFFIKTKKKFFHYVEPVHYIGNEFYHYDLGFPIAQTYNNIGICWLITFIEIFIRMPQFSEAFFDINFLVKQIEILKTTKISKGILSKKKFLVSLIFARYLNSNELENYYQNILLDIVKYWLLNRYDEEDLVKDEESGYDEHAIFDKILPLINGLKYNLRIDTYCDTCTNLIFYKFKNDKTYATYYKYFFFNPNPLSNPFCKCNKLREWETNFNVEQIPKVFYFKMRNFQEMKGILSIEKKLKNAFQIKILNTIFTYKLCTLTRSYESHICVLILTEDGWIKHDNNDISFFMKSTLDVTDYFYDGKKKYYPSMLLYSLVSIKTLPKIKSVKKEKLKKQMQEFYETKYLKPYIKAKNEVDIHKKINGIMNNLTNMFDDLNKNMNKYNKNIKGIPKCRGVKTVNNNYYPEVICGTENIHDYNIKFTSCPSRGCQGKEVYNMLYHLRHNEKTVLYCSVLCLYRDLVFFSPINKLKCSCGLSLNKIMDKNKWKNENEKDRITTIEDEFKKHWIHIHLKIRNVRKKHEFLTKKILSNYNMYPFEDKEEEEEH